MNDFAQLADGDGTLFLLRWRGRLEGPYTGAVMEKKLAANEIGLLHEVYYEGKWITLRDYITERRSTLVREEQTREAEDTAARAVAARQAQEQTARRRAELLAEECRKNDLLAAELVQPSPAAPAPAPPSPRLKPHRGGLILALGVIGLFVCGPLCTVAWLAGNRDLKEMEAGLMDDSGRSKTSSGRNFGILGTLLWVASSIIIFMLAV